MLVRPCLALTALLRVYYWFPEPLSSTLLFLIFSVSFPADSTSLDHKGFIWKRERGIEEGERGKSPGVLFNLECSSSSRHFQLKSLSSQGCIVTRCFNKGETKKSAVKKLIFISCSQLYNMGEGNKGYHVPATWYLLTLVPTVQRHHFQPAFKYSSDTM